MPVIITFDIEAAPTDERNRLQSMFERFGWQQLGGTSYRYPSLGSKEPVEDWFNHVIPVLMLFRAYILKSKRKLTRFSLDTQSSTGFNPDNKPAFGHAPAHPTDIKFYPTKQPAFGLKNLKNWLASVDFPY